MEIGHDLEAEIYRIILDPENAGHSGLQSQEQVIQYLCREENVLVLAKDIAANGLNPLDRVGLIPDGDELYYVIEGNRRVCACNSCTIRSLPPMRTCGARLKRSLRDGYPSRSCRQWSSTRGTN